MRSCYKAAILMMSDPGYRKRLFNPETSADQLDITPQDLDLLRNLDPHSLDILTTGNAGKRIQTLEAALPRTVATLRFHYPLLIETYTSQTKPLPHNQDRTQFLDALSNWQSLYDQERRFLHDLAHIELATANTADAWTSLHPTPNRNVRQSPHATRVTLQGPLEGKISPGATKPPNPYPPSPGHAVVVRRAETLFVARIEGINRILWKLCASQPTIREVASALGPQVEPVLEKWLHHGVLELL